MAYGHLPLLDSVRFQIEAHERVAVLGRNGTGKSTLLKIVSGEQAPDAGTVWRHPGLTIARLEQDEPTNHLDIEAITWMEQFLVDYDGSVLFVTHDRAFLQRVATRIVELDRGRLTSWPVDYATYVRRKEEALANEAALNERFDAKL